MIVLAVILGIGLFALVVGVGYWFADQEQKTMRIPPEELDEDTRQARREAAASINNAGLP